MTSFDYPASRLKTPLGRVDHDDLILLDEVHLYRPGDPALPHSDDPDVGYLPECD